jgi:very-short-patch-repair endonuclease
MSPTVVAPIAIARARKLRKVMTDGETKLWRLLREFRKLYGIHVRKQVPIGPFVADFAIHEARLVIELDGEFHFEGDSPDRDRNRDDWFAGAGYRVLRLTTGEFAENPGGCIELILRELGVTI